MRKADLISKISDKTGIPITGRKSDTIEPTNTGTKKKKSTKQPVAFYRTKL